jgi:hypothetical protein
MPHFGVSNAGFSSRGALRPAASSVSASSNAYPILEVEHTKHRVVVASGAAVLQDSEWPACLPNDFEDVEALEDVVRLETAARN